MFFEFRPSRSIQCFLLKQIILLEANNSHRLSLIHKIITAYITFKINMDDGIQNTSQHVKSKCMIFILGKSWITGTHGMNKKTKVVGMGQEKK